MEKPKKISPEQRYYDILKEWDEARLVVEAETLLRTIHNKKTELNMMKNIMALRGNDTSSFVEYIDYPHKFITNTIEEDLYYGIDNYGEQG
jgi:hypothetical protein